MLGVIHPWRMVGAIALGHPAPPPAPAGAAPAAPARKPIARVVQWLDDDAEPDP
jgi:hypothetical protein